MLSLLASTLEKYTPHELEQRKIRKQKLIEDRRKRIEDSLKLKQQKNTLKKENIIIAGKEIEISEELFNLINLEKNN
ncbi:hypothetical protein [Aliarcobacter butzleri]|nr:hypothetical protein [Aliarcobacter butzleri]